MKKLILFITALLFLNLPFNSCSTGSDPAPVINDLFKIPIKYALEFVNTTNDIALEVKAIALNHLKTKNNKIKSNVPECIDALVYRKKENQSLDSIVIDYGDKLCRSNGAQFLGKIVVKATNQTLKEFNVTLRGLKSRNFSISGDFKIKITGAEGGKDFTISSTNLKYSVTDKITEKVSSFPLSNYEASYKYIRSENDELDYIDDVFTFSLAFNGVMPDGAVYNFSTEKELKYTYRCKHILGGEGVVELSDLGKAVANFGGGDVDRDCDDKVSVAVEGIEYSETL